MSAELQIRTSILSSIATRAIEARLQDMPFLTAGVGRVKVSAAPVAIARVNAAVRLQVPLTISLIESDQVSVAKDSPAQIEISRTQEVITATLELAATGVIITLRCIDVDLNSLEAMLGTNASTIKATLISSIGCPFISDLGNIFQKIGVAIPRFSRVDLVGEVVAMRFEPSGAATARLPAGQDWGLFLDASAVERLAKSKLPTDFTSHTTSLTIEARWRSDSTIPHVDLYYSCKAPQVGEPVVGDVSGTIGCDFSLTATEAKRLRSTVRWSLDIKLGALVPQFVNDIVKEAITGFMNPARFGGIPVDEHTFIRENDLPDISFGGASLEHTTLIATANGMTFGGQVRIPKACARNSSSGDLAEVAASCTCASGDESDRCNRCRTRMGNPPPKSQMDSAFEGIVPERTTWEREILAKLLVSLKKAESWATAALPCRDFITLPAGVSSTPTDLRNPPQGASRPRTSDSSLIRS